MHAIVPRSAYTLIEVLAVVAIAGLVAAALTPALVRVATADPMTEAVRLVQGFDRLARQQAVGVGGSWRIDDGRLTSAISGWQPPDGRLPSGCQIVVQLPRDGAALPAVTIDRAGCSADVRVVVTVERQTRSFQIVGLTGAWIAETSAAAVPR